MALNTINLDAVKDCIGENLVQLITQQHHVYMAASTYNLKQLMINFKANCGVFGKTPLFDRNGCPYLNLKDNDTFTDFHLWTADYNQQDVFRMGVVGSPTGFTMVIDALTRPNVLRELHNKIYHGEGYLPFEEGLSNVLRFVDDIGWCYIPLSEEINLALVLFNNKKYEEFKTFSMLFPELNSPR